MLIRSLFVFLLLGFFALNSSFANPDGKTGRTASTVGCGGGGCHTSTPSTATTVTVTSKSGSFSTTPGGKLELTVIVAHSTQKLAGFNLAVKTSKDGSLNSGGVFTAGTTSQALLSEITHKSPLPMSGGKAEFSFTWTAPNKEGTFFMQTVGNATSGLNGAWNWATPIQIVVKTSSGVDDVPTQVPVLSVFPNPSTSDISINYSILSAGEYQFVVTELTGRTLYSEPTIIEQIGEHSKTWNGRNSEGASVANGQYVAILRSNERTYSVPFVISR